MDLNDKYVFGAVVVVLAVASYFVFFSSSDFGAAPDGKFAQLAQCLTEKGAVMYGTDWCPHCKNQKAMFGGDFKYINYVNCDENKQACADAGVAGYPTWHINGKVLLGTQPLDVLAEAAGCTYPSN